MDPKLFRSQLMFLFISIILENIPRLTAQDISGKQDISQQHSTPLPRL